MHIKKDENTSIDLGDYVIRELITGDHTPAFSIARVTLKGDHPASVSNRSDRGYVILSGAGRVTVDGETHAVEAGDAVMIPKGSVHSVTGDLEYFVINTPPFSPEHERAV